MSDKPRSLKKASKRLAIRLKSFERDGLGIKSGYRKPGSMKK